MNNQTIADIYAANEKIHQDLKTFLSNLSAEQTNFLPDGEKWTIVNLVEHIAIVEEGMSKISAKLLKQSQSAGKKADGKVKLSENFAKKSAKIRDLKLEAPERVQPTGTQTITESLAKMDENRKLLEELRPLFESVECSDYKFPHPFLGEMTAHEWLALIGGHEIRHLKQLENMLEKVK